MLVLIAGNNSIERYQCWYNLPVLLGLCYNSISIAATSYNMSERTLSNELHAVTYCAKCIALAQQEATNKMLNYGSRFLHPKAQSLAEEMLDCFSKIASSVSNTRYDDMHSQYFCCLSHKSVAAH